MEIKHPLHPEEITPEWANFALKEGGIINESVVNEIKNEIIGGEMGFLSSVVRVELTYDKPEAGVPETVPLYNHENLAHKQDS